MHYSKVNFIIIFYVLCWISFSETVPAKWPARYPRCYRDDPNLNKCLLEATKTMKPFLLKGLPEFGVAPISPFIVPEVKLQQGTSAINYKVLFKDLKILGFETYEFEKFDFDVKNTQFSAAVKFEAISLETTFDAKGKLLAIPVEGTGLVTANFSETLGTVLYKTEKLTKNGIVYLKSKQPTLHIKVGKVVDHYISKLFEDNELLSKAAHQVIEDNLEFFLEEVKPVIEQAIAKMLVDILETSLSHLPYDEIFPEHT